MATSGHRDRRRWAFRRLRCRDRGKDFAIKRAGKVTRDGVEQQLHALVVVGRAQEDRRQLAAQGATADDVVDELFGDGLFFQHERHQFIVVE